MTTLNPLTSPSKTSTPLVKLCGMFRDVDILAANACHPDFIGFIFWPKSHRNVDPLTAATLKSLLDPTIKAVGVFVDSPADYVASLLNQGIIDLAQLHGSEDEDYIASLRQLTDKPLIKAFKIRSIEDTKKAEASSADYILLDNGTGTGETFDWSLIRDVKRPFFLAGGLNADNVSIALKDFRPFAVDVSSAIETDKRKDPVKMEAFVKAVRTIR